MSTATERQFLIHHPPATLKPICRQSVTKGYLFNSDGGVLEIRHSGRRFYQELKLSEGGQNKRLEIRLRRNQFQSLWPATAGARIQLMYSEYLENGNRIGIHRFDAPMKGLATATVVFPEETEAIEFSPPFWFGPEITYDSRFLHPLLARNPVSPQFVPFNPDVSKSRVVIGAMPFQVKNGQLQVVIITSKTRQRKIFPKGQPESRLSAAEVARVESFEEAGVEGEIVAPPILIAAPSDASTHWVLFPQKITRLHEKWEEKSVRKRFVVPVSAALKDPEFHLIEPALRFLSTHGPRFSRL